MTWERKGDLPGRCSTVIKYSYWYCAFCNQVNEKLKQFDYKGSIITCCREYWRLCVLNVTCRDNLSFWSQWRGLERWVLLKLSRGCGIGEINISFLILIIFHAMIADHSWDLLVLSKGVRSNSADNWKFTVMESSGCCTVRRFTENIAKCKCP